MTSAIAAPKPLMRGYLHLGAAVVSPFALVVLLMLARGPAGYTAAALFGAGAIALFTASAAYHLPPWPAGIRGVVRRIDHATIFAFIAFAYAPFCLVALPPAWGIPMLSTVAGLAFAGAVLKLAWPNLPRYLNLGLYVTLGWAAVVMLPVMLASLSPAGVALTAASGLLYTAGAVAHALKRPNPVPALFGHHELFHAATVVATACLYLAVVTDALG